MNDNFIKVVVVAYKDRDHLMMRYLDPATGKQVARSTGTSNRRKAEREAARWEAELLDQGQTRSSGRLTWEAFRERYESDVLPSLAQKTALKIDTVFDAVEAILRPRYVQDLTAERLSYFQSKLRGGRAEATIKGYLAHLRSALRWAHKMGFLFTVPVIENPKRAKRSKMMKGRPVTADEFQRMLATTETIVGPAAAPSWRHFLEGLWWSGLRLSESLELSWDDPSKLCIQLGEKRPMLAIPAELEKGFQDRLLPIAPEFVEFLLRTPAAERTGRVFCPRPNRKSKEYVEADWAMHIIARIGKAANIVVNVDARTRKTKHASAHDLRRSFGERWASRVMPQVLMVLMRHASIETTMKYYVGRNAQTAADALWSAYESAGGST